MSNFFQNGGLTVEVRVNANSPKKQLVKPNEDVEAISDFNKTQQIELKPLQ